MKSNLVISKNFYNVYIWYISCIYNTHKLHECTIKSICVYSPIKKYTNVQILDLRVVNGTQKIDAQ